MVQGDKSLAQLLPVAPHHWQASSDGLPQEWVSLQHHKVTQTHEE